MKKFKLIIVAVVVAAVISTGKFDFSSITDNITDNISSSFDSLYTAIDDKSYSEGSLNATIKADTQYLASNYSGNPYIEVNGNIPFFTADEITTESYEFYSDLDKLGRCGYAMACVGLDLMPTEERGAIGSVKPTGWHTVKYDGIDGKYLYNRCHLIAYCLAGENANEKNLITGTRYMNIAGMLPFETDVARYIEDTGNHVMYRVTPIFENDNLLAEGVLMEAYSVEDGGELQFCVFVYNVQPGIAIDYATGNSEEEI